jgi:hypothetical protein
MPTMQVRVLEYPGASISRVTFMVFAWTNKPKARRRLVDCTIGNFDTTTRKWFATLTRPQGKCIVVAISFTEINSSTHEVRVVGKRSRRYAAL